MSQNRNTHSEERRRLLAAAEALDAKRQFGASALLKSAALAPRAREMTEAQRNEIDDINSQIADAEDKGAWARAARLKSLLLKLTSA